MAERRQSTNPFVLPLAITIVIRITINTPIRTPPVATLRIDAPEVEQQEEEAYWRIYGMYNCCEGEKCTNAVGRAISGQVSRKREYVTVSEDNTKQPPTSLSNERHNARNFYRNPVFAD